MNAGAAAAGLTLAKTKKAALVAGPAYGPAIVTLFGIDVPVLALALSIAGLLLARAIAPPPLRKLTRNQEWSLTALLVLILSMIVTGQLFGSEPLGAGMAVMWGVGLGFSGLLVIEFFGQRIAAGLRALLGLGGDKHHGP